MTLAPTVEPFGPVPAPLLVTLGTVSSDFRDTFHNAFRRPRWASMSSRASFYLG